MGTAKSRGNGEGTIFKRQIHGKQMWVMEYTFNMVDSKTGKRKRKTIYGKTRTAVKDKLEKLLVELNTNSYVDKNKIIFKDLTKQFVDDGYRLNKLSESSYKRKISTYNQICTHYMANMEMQKITEQDVKDFLIYITKYSNSVIGKIYGLINNTFKRAVRKNIIKYNFLDDKIEFCKPTSNRRDKKVRGFTIDEQKQFLKVVMDENNPFKYKYQFLLSMFSGARMGEINALDVNKDIDFNNKIIHIRRTLTRDKNDRTCMGDYTKTKNGVRDIIMDSQLEFILRDYLKKEFIPNDHDLLFYNPKNIYYSTGQVNMVFKRLCEKNNIAQGYDVNQHMLRHTFATRCIEAGMPANVLSKIMGHADIRTTLEVYCDVFNNYEKQHANRTYDYLSQNHLLLKQVNEDSIPEKDLNRIVENIKKMYIRQDDKLIKLLKLIA